MAFGDPPSAPANGALPWRGPGPDRPDLPLPPGRMPLRSHGETRKRWRYVGVYGEDVMLCAARVEIGPLSQSFWAVWDRARGQRWAHTRIRPGGSEVVMRGPRVELRSRGVNATLDLGDGEAVESLCPSGRAWAWTRKRAGIPARGTLEAGGRRRQFEARAVDDESAGYHARHTAWSWSAGVGTAVDGRAIAWNLVSGINDPPRNSERAVWVDGTPSEPDPVAFHGLDRVDLGDGARLEFATESERARRDNLLLLRSRYVHRFGTFSGNLGGVELAEGFGVMEEHEALW
jgi:hypothetical protein